MSLSPKIRRRTDGTGGEEDCFGSALIKRYCYDKGKIIGVEKRADTRVRPLIFFGSFPINARIGQ
jgi:hypothetical protein